MVVAIGEFHRVLVSWSAMVAKLVFWYRVVNLGSIVLNRFSGSAAHRMTTEMEPELGEAYGMG